MDKPIAVIIDPDDDRKFGEKTKEDSTGNKKTTTQRIADKNKNNRRNKGPNNETYLHKNNAKMEYDIKHEEYIESKLKKLFNTILEEQTYPRASKQAEIIMNQNRGNPE